jgi:hypothetical protein
MSFEDKPREDAEVGKKAVHLSKINLFRCQCPGKMFRQDNLKRHCCDYFCPHMLTALAILQTLMNKCPMSVFTVMKGIKFSVQDSST